MGGRSLGALLLLFPLALTAGSAAQTPAAEPAPPSEASPSEAPPSEAPPSEASPPQASPPEPPPGEAPTAPTGDQEPGASTGDEPPAPPAPAPLPARFARWLEEVDPIILSAERRVFLELVTDYQRDAFIERFWRVRDPYTQTARNELKVRYLDRLLQARALYGTLEDDRSRIYLVHGAPAARVDVRCSGSYRPAEIWVYQGSEQVGFEIVLIFLVSREGRAGVWHPESPGADAQVEAAARCQNGDQLRLAASSIRAQGLDWELAFRRMLAKPRPRQQEWLATFTAFTTELPPDAETFDAELAIEFPGRHRLRTVTQGMLTVPVAAVEAGDYLGFRSFNFELVGEVVLDGKLFESFRYKFSFPESEYAERQIPLAFQRYLRPGEYRLLLRLEDTNGGTFYRHERQLRVPAVESEFERPEALRSETARLFREAAEALARGETSIRLVPPKQLLATGFVRFDALTVGDEIDRVAFLLDERRVLTKTRPPYNVEIDLGEMPRPHTVRVEALDDQGTVVAWDEARVNTAGQGFGVRLVEPRAGATYDRSLLARARVDLPDDRALDRLELYLNERLVATLYQPPYAQPIALPGGEELAYVRAVAYLADGTSAEDLVFLNAPGKLEQIDVQVVELYTTVLDRGGRPVRGLGRGEFEVFEDGRRQEIVRFEPVATQPISAGILFDNSASMRPLLDVARIAALTFFQDAIKPRDRAAVITFNRLPRLAVGLTNDLRLLGGGLAGLSAEGETALYDAIMFGLYYFAGVKGQRALVLLSDGRDEASRFSFDQALEYARRAGVAIYVVGLNLPRESPLSRLAEETGGRAYYPADLTQLPAIYGFIQDELRSQYLLTYQSDNTAADEAFRAIEVRLADKSLTARTLAGYYP